MSSGKWQPFCLGLNVLRHLLPDKHLIHAIASWLMSNYTLFFEQEHDCKLTKEIIELIDREADLLMRGIREASLEGLRKRIATLFLQYIKTPTFNPEAARLLKVNSYEHLAIC